MSQTEEVKQKEYIQNKKKAEKIIRYRTLMASGVGFMPIPFLDAAGILTIQLWMISDLAKVYKIPFKKNVAKSLIGSLVGNVGTVSIMKLIPGVNLLGGGAMAISGGATTYALGKVFRQHFDQGGTLLSFDPEKSRAYFDQLYEESKVTVEELKEQETTFKEADTQALASVATLKKANADLLATISKLEKQLKDSKRDRAVAVAAAKTQTKVKEITENVKKKGNRKWLVWLGRGIIIIIIIALLIEALYQFGIISSFWDDNNSSSDSTQTSSIVIDPNATIDANASQASLNPVIDTANNLTDTTGNGIVGDTSISATGDTASLQVPLDNSNSSGNPTVPPDDGTSSNPTQDTSSRTLAN